jgi:dipeptide/tripeptide permease
MVHRENILTLLRAKYYFHCAVLIVPLLVMLPAVIEGKFSILMMLSYMLLSSGLLYFILFQLAVSNKQTLPLDQKLTGKAQVENGHQLIFELVGMTLPLILVMLLLLVFEEETCYVILLAIGIALTALHPLWLRHVYVRMMKRKYKNLEGFHSSR